MSETAAQTSNVTVQSTSSTKPPAKVPQTQLISVRLLVNSSGKGAPAFNQGNYHDPLPVQNAANSRTIQTSGCGLCAWASLIAATGCCAPVFVDTNSTTLRVPSAGAVPINPSNLLKYFSDYAVSKTTPSEGLDRMPEGWNDPKRNAASAKFANANIFNTSESGVLRNDSSTVKDAINNLVALNNPGTTPAFDNSQGASGGPTGTDIAEITQALEAGNPVILAVCFDSDTNPSHQVLAVGIAKVAGQTYYVINDSGFGNMDPFPLLKNAGTSIGPNILGACTASPKKNPGKDGPWGYGSIFAYRILGGLQSVTNLTLKPPPY